MSIQAPPPSLPPPPPTFDANLWRQKLAGLTDPDYSGEDNAVSGEHKAAAISLCVCLCELFGESLDRKTLWERIGSALATAASKCDDGDADRFVSLALEHVKADAGYVARHDVLPSLLASWSGQLLAWRQGLIRYIVGHSFAVIAHSRMQWERIKAAKHQQPAGEQAAV